MGLLKRLFGAPDPVAFQDLYWDRINWGSDLGSIREVLNSDNTKAARRESQQLINKHARAYHHACKAVRTRPDDAWAQGLGWRLWLALVKEMNLGESTAHELYPFVTQAIAQVPVSERMADRAGFPRRPPRL